MTRYPLGRRMAVTTLREWPRTAGHAARHVGAASIAISRAGRSGDRSRLHRLERRWASRVVDALDIDLRLEGLDHIDPNRPHVVAPLHESFVDVAALFHLPLDLRFVAREELASWPLLGRCLRDTGQIVVDPDRPISAMRGVREQAATAVAAGESVVVFPQGSILGVEAAFQGGVDWLAGQLDLPILPVVLAGGHRVWEWPYTPLLRYGSAVYLEALPVVAAGELAAIAGEMRHRALDNGHAPVRRFDPDRDGYWDGYGYEIDPTFPELAARVARHRALRPATLPVG
ncbi:MAG: lysophospholipid acyltransferase family protein [Acidimicrobiia bacterium]